MDVMVRRHHRQQSFSQTAILSAPPRRQSRPRFRADPARAAGWRAESCPRSRRAKTFSNLAGTRTKMRSGGISGGSRAMVSSSRLVRPLRLNSGLGRSLRAAGQKRAPKPPAMISADVRSTQSARRCPFQSPPSSLSLVSNRLRISDSRASSLASKRNTSAGWVLEARTSPQPSVEIHPHPVDFGHVIVGAEIVGEPGDYLGISPRRGNRRESPEWSRSAAGR